MIEEGKTERIVLAHAEEIYRIKKKYPKVSKEIDQFCKNVQQSLKELDHEIQDIDQREDRDLVTVLVINGIHRMTDEIFLC